MTVRIALVLYYCVSTFFMLLGKVLVHFLKLIDCRVLTTLIGVF